MGELTTYKKMTLAPNDLLGVLKQEIGLKSTCMPFAVKAVEALRSLPNLTESEALKAANTFLSDMQTLNQGGITAEDYDKIDFVKRGKVITISARVEAFLRAAARKGYRMTETIIAVPNDDASTTYFKENFSDGVRVYTLEDKRVNTDREITSQRIIDGYFNKYICRLEVTDIKQNKLLVTPICEMTNAELLKISSASEQGIYKSRWEEYKDDWGKIRKRKAVTTEMNDPTAFWIKWTKAMVEKTIIRQVLHRVKEVLPELKETIYAFDRDEAEYQEVPQIEKHIEIPVVTNDVDLKKLTPSQLDDVLEALDLFKANPKLATDKTNEIKALFENGEPLQKVINIHYASIINIQKSKKLYPQIKQYFEVLPNE